MPTRVAIDSMGGDHGLSVTVPAAYAFLDQDPDVHVLLVGRRDAIVARIRADKLAVDHPRVQIVEASEVVTMDDPIEVALRRKKDSSMRVAVGLIKEGRADAAVSAGNTGALMAISRYVLKTIEGIDRPAIATVMPNQTGGATTVLDLGANVDCQAEHLLQFAIMGSALVTSLEGKESPKIGLLNIGEEVIKGNDVVKEAGELMRAAAERGEIDFFGNVEGNDIFKGTVDVVVCDGFVGNVALKTTEGIAQMLAGFIREEFTRNPLTYVAALVAMPVLNRFKKRVDHRRYNGASLLGLRGLVVKSHGSADAFAFGYAIRRAVEEARHDLIPRIAASMERAGPSRAVASGVAGKDEKQVASATASPAASPISSLF